MTTTEARTKVLDPHRSLPSEDVPSGTPSPRSHPCVPRNCHSRRLSRINGEHERRDPLLRIWFERSTLKDDDSAESADAVSDVTRHDEAAHIVPRFFTVPLQCFQHGATYARRSIRGNSLAS
jgi:hypothetical protein